MRRQMSKFLLRQEDLQREPVSQSTKLMSNSLCSSKMSNSGHDLARPLIRLTLQDHDLHVTSESQKHIGVTSGLPSSSNLRRQTWLGQVLGGFPGRRLRRIAWDSKDFQGRIRWQSRPGGRRRLDEVCQARTRRFSFFGRMWQVRPGFSKAVLLGRPGGFLGLSEGLAPCEEPLRSCADGPDSARTKDLTNPTVSLHEVCHLSCLPRYSVQPKVY